MAIVFYPENVAVPAAIREWQLRNPDWRRPLDDPITCPVCGLAIRAIVDFALLDWDRVRAEVGRYRDQYLRAACSDHFWPTEAYWAIVASRSR